MAEPGQYQILRIETYKRLDERLVSHVKGETRPPTARPVDPDIVSVYPAQPPLGAIVELGGEGAGAARELIERTRPTGRGRPPGEAIEILMAGPPSYGSAGQWSEARELEWARESFVWLSRIVGPDSLIVTAALHRDEKSPHVQVLVVPVHEGRLGWTAVKNAAAARLAPDLPHPPRTKYAGFQDDYHARVGCRFGLARGEVGSQATHAQIDRAAGARAELKRCRDQWVHERSEFERCAEKAAATEHDARIDALLAEVVAAGKAAQAAEDERKAVEAVKAAKAAKLREALACARVSFERDRASMLAAAARVVGEQITEQASEFVVLRRAADKLDGRLVKARTARAEVDEHVQVKRREPRQIRSDFLSPIGAAQAGATGVVGAVSDPGRRIDGHGALRWRSPRT